MNTADEYRNSLLTERELEILRREITKGRMRDDIRRYSTIPSRHVHHDGNGEALNNLLKDLHRISKGRLWSRRQDFRLYKDRKRPRCKNVEMMLPGVNSSQVIIISAHLDCTAERDPSYRPQRDHAPGADDDASGIGGVLAAARAIVKLATEHPVGRPRAEIRFVLFNAEELAQRGSRVYARRQAKLATSISAVYQMDMIGYRGNGDASFELHAGFRRDVEVQAASLDVAHHLVEVCVAAKFPLSPQVYFHRSKNRDPGQGFSDHTSFHRKGFPAVLVSENFYPGQGSVLSPASPNPDYHLKEDRLANLDPEYAAYIARAVAAAAWHRATHLAGGHSAHMASHNSASGGGHLHHPQD